MSYPQSDPATWPLIAAPTSSPSSSTSHPSLFPYNKFRSREDLSEAVKLHERKKITPDLKKEDNDHFNRILTEYGYELQV